MKFRTSAPFWALRTSCWYRKIVKKKRGPLFSGPLYATPLSVGVFEVQEGSQRIQSGRQPASGPHRWNFDEILFFIKGSTIGHKELRVVKRSLLLANPFVGQGQKEFYQRLLIYVFQINKDHIAVKKGDIQVAEVALAVVEFDHLRKGSLASVV